MYRAVSSTPHQMRVLLVEDEPQAAQIVAKGLREHTYTVDVASDGRAALFQLSLTDYDAVVLDVSCRSRTASRSAAPSVSLEVSFPSSW